MLIILIQLKCKHSFFPVAYSLTTYQNQKSHNSHAPASNDPVILKTFSHVIKSIIVIAKKDPLPNNCHGTLEFIICHKDVFTGNTRLAKPVSQKILSFGNTKSLCIIYYKYIPNVHYNVLSNNCNPSLKKDENYYLQYFLSNIIQMWFITCQFQGYNAII